VIEPVLLQTRRLDDISEVQHVDFLKIDIQGSELAVFKGGKRSSHRRWRSEPRSRL
jgi:FkbM family methyltransferase